MKSKRFFIVSIIVLLSQLGFGFDDKSAPSLPGINQQLGATKTPTDAKILCYKLAPVSRSALQPYILVPAADNSDFPNGICAEVDDDHPLVQRDKIAIGIYGDKAAWSAIELINLNITFQKGSTLNPAPVRQTVSTSNTFVFAEQKDHAEYVEWPVPIAGDTIPEITVKVLYRSGKTEELLTLLDQTYPQVHNLSYFNISTGVVASTLHDPTFARVQTAAAVGTPNQPGFQPATFATQQTAGDPVIAPVLMFTFYYPPFDAERSWHKGDLIPQPNIGFSLTSPSTDFFVGGASEIQRHVQLVAGLHIGKITELPTVPFDDPTSNAAPITRKSFHFGAFYGLTFNIDFIKGLFGGSK